MELHRKTCGGVGVGGGLRKGSDDNEWKPLTAEGICEQSMHVCACLCVSFIAFGCRVESMVWHIYGLELFTVLEMETAFCLSDSMLCCGLLTELRDGGIHLSWSAPFGVEFLDLSRWDGFVGLASSTVHGLDPQDAVLLVIAGEDHSVALLHCIEESSASIQAWGNATLEKYLNIYVHVDVEFYYFSLCCLTWLGVTVVHSISIQLQKFLWFRLFLSIAAHRKRILAHLQSQKKRNTAHMN